MAAPEDEGAIEALAAQRSHKPFRERVRRKIVFTSVRDDCAYSDAGDCEEIDDIGEFHTLYVMNTDGTGQTRISGDEFAQYATWSPDGRYIMFTPAPKGFYVMRSDGSGLTSMQIEGVEGSITLFDWTE